MPIIYAQYLYWYWYLKVTYWYWYWYLKVGYWYLYWYLDHWYWYWYLFVEYLIQDWCLQWDETGMCSGSFTIQYLLRNDAVRTAALRFLCSSVLMGMYSI